jgi:O-antigen ligase
MVDIAAVAGIALIAALFAWSAYAFDPLLLPLAALGVTVVCIVFLRPALGIGFAFLCAPLELYALPLPTGSISASESLLACVGLAYLGRLLARSERVRTPSVRDVPYAVLLGAIAIGLGFATDPSPIGRILILWSLFYLAYLQVQSCSPEVLRKLCWALAIGGGVLGAVGTAEFLAAGGGSLYSGGAGADVRAIGTFGEAVGDSNYFAAFLQLAALPAIALLVLDPRRNLPILPFAVLAVVGLAFSLSRGGMLGFAAGILLLLLFWGRARRVAAGVAALLVVLTVAGANPLVGSEQLQTVTSRLGTIDEFGQTETNARPELFDAAADMAIEHPVVGIGLNEFDEHSARRGLTERGLPHETAHNVYLSLAAETGLVGLGALLFFGGFLVRRAVVAVRARDPLARALALGLSAALFGFAIQGATVSLNRNNLLWATFLIVAGMLVALSDRASQPTQERAAQS